MFHHGDKLSNFIGFCGWVDNIVDEWYFGFDWAEHEDNIQAISLGDQKFTKNFILQILLIFAWDASDKVL